MDFETLTLERKIACPPGRLFALLTDADARAAWGGPDDASVIVVDEADIREGGHEKSRCGPKDNPEFSTRSTFHVIRPPERMINTETLTVAGEMLSVSLVTFDIAGTEAGCALTVTLQIASLAGPELFDDYRGGWSASLDNLRALAERATS